jgi:hypothetical protein
VDRLVLERLQAVQNQQGSTMRDELRQSFALLPGRSDSWTELSKSIVKPVTGGHGSKAGMSVINFVLHPKQVTARNGMKGRLCHLLLPF